MKVAFPIPLNQLVGMGSVIALVPSLSLQPALWPRISCPRDGSLQWCYSAALKQCQHISSPFPIIISLDLCRTEPGLWGSSDAFFEAVNPHSNPCTKLSGKGFFFALPLKFHFLNPHLTPKKAFLPLPPIQTFPFLGSSLLCDSMSIFSSRLFFPWVKFSPAHSFNVLPLLFHSSKTFLSQTSVR